MQKYTVALIVALFAGVALGGADYTPVSEDPTNSLANKTLTEAGSITFDSDVVIDGTASNQMDVTLSATGADAGNLRVISGEAASADGDDIGMQFIMDDTGGTAVVAYDINVDLTDADTGTEDSAVTHAIQVAGSSAVELTINSDGIASEAVAITPASGVGTNAAALTVTAEGAAIDYTALMAFSHENASFITADAGTFTNQFKLLVSINGTNYAIPLIPAP